MATQAGATAVPSKEYVDKTLTEQDKLLADLFQSFVGYTRRTSKQRDNGDDIATIVGACAQSEKYDKTTKASLGEVATVLANVEEYRDNHVRNLENHVLHELAKFGNQHRGSQTNLRRSLSQSQRRKSGANGQSQAEQTFSRELIDFESRRVTGLRSVLQNYMFSELAWHLKAAELYSNAFKALQAIDENEDVEDFRRSLQLPRETQSLKSTDRHQLPGGGTGTLS
ncbi:hypothetical protein BOX15_Mlig017306g1 [Macrostomum lignano]|uniref:AH domain-containing protein n=3 Tax=Macrostomum lignano TaxID=282301 RepID=A0A1I8GEA0_9PLAT|nr:hypothetical protein BOX15_Mlig017306g2 [Macrostomum lignano]PAA73580.1 hypothetical protein BOX15_Mlig017306g1 [Macrostomum lignano]